MITYLEESRPFRALIGGLLLAISLGCVGFLAVTLARDLSLWVFGRRVAAVVVDRWAEETSAVGASEKTFEYFIAYEFVTPDGRRIAKSSSVGPREWVGLGMPGSSHVVYQEQQTVPADWVQDEVRGTEPGEWVEVIYFPLIPTHNRLSDTRYIPVYVCLYVPVLILGLIGFRLGWSVLRAGDLSSRQTWFAKRDEPHKAH